MSFLTENLEYIRVVQRDIFVNQRGIRHDLALIDDALRGDAETMTAAVVATYGPFRGFVGVGCDWLEPVYFKMKDERVISWDFVLRR